MLNQLQVTAARIVADGGSHAGKVLELTLPNGARITGRSIDELEREFVRGNFINGAVQ